MNRSITTKPPEEHALAAFEHLQKLSQTLLATSPALSAYLASQRASIESVHKLSPKGRGQDKSCHACASILISGWSCKRSRPEIIKRHQGKKAKGGIAKAKSATKTINVKAMPTKSESVSYKCDRCSSITRFDAPKKKVVSAKIESSIVHQLPTGTRPSITSTPSASPVVSDMPSVNKPVRPSADSSGRKRSKKSKTGGLAALLAKNKSESASPAGFDLMDFMKSV